MNFDSREVRTMLPPLPKLAPLPKLPPLPQLAPLEKLPPLPPLPPLGPIPPLSERMQLWGEPRPSERRSVADAEPTSNGPYRSPPLASG